MNKKLDVFFSRYEFLLPVIIFILFLCAALPGIEWGAPALWNPDELVWRINSALRGELIFDETEPDWNYPSLPKYVMYAIGWLVQSTGRSSFAVIVTLRMFSAFLGAVSGVLIYYLTREIGVDKKYSMLASLFYVVSGVVVANGRFAHNDLYLLLFTILSVYAVIKFRFSSKLLWFYVSFFFVGLASSSKYTGGSLILLPIAVYIVLHWSKLRTSWFVMLRNLIVGGLVAYLAYGLGTPKALTSPIEYFSKVIPSLQNLTDYGFNSGTKIGLIGQWGTLRGAVGNFLYYLFIITLIWFLIRWMLQKFIKIEISDTKKNVIGIFLFTLLIFDLPFIISINYVQRYFIPFVPFFAILSVLFIEEILVLSKKWNLNFVQPLILLALFIGIIYSSLRLVSFSLLFINDARIPASEYIAMIRGYQTSIEYTLYPPFIEKRRFERAHNYPIYFVEWVEDTVPTGGRYEYNQAEKGLLDRDTDYFVIDSFTYKRFYTDSICATTPVECDFFKRLIAGEVENFRLVEKFTYTLPPYLPRVSVSAVNPDILIFERVR